MPTITNKPVDDRARRVRRAGPVVSAFLAAGLLLSACGGDDSATRSVADVAVTDSDTGSAAPDKAAEPDPVAFSQCIRDHGVPDFPDPDGEGRVTLGQTGGGDKGFAPDSEVFKAAQQACKAFEPRPSADQAAQVNDNMLQMAQCMREHGIPNFPDPQPGGGLMIDRNLGIDLDSPEFKAANDACQQFGPKGPGGQGPGGPSQNKVGE
jgi:hypothetical protein